jgi:alanine racemase
MDVCLRKGSKKRGEYIPIMTDAAEIARQTGTITHEVLCAATRRAEFLYDE